MTGPDPSEGPPPPRETLVLLVQVLPSERFFLIVRLGHRSDVQRVAFDPNSGGLVHSGREGVDVFASEGEAMEELKLRGKPETVATGKAVLGYAVVGGWGLLLLAENVRVSGELPGGHKIKTVTCSRWHRIPCKADIEQKWTGLGREDLDARINKIIEFPITGAHFFCETADLTRPFPSTFDATAPSWQFVWNRWLSESFRSVGLESLSPALLQGTAELRPLEDVNNKPFMMVKISRRSRLNPGTRYIARGLDDHGDPGNEIECEQIVWREPEEQGGPVPWCRYLWRRGTVPIRWGVNLKNSGLGEAEIVIQSKQNLRGTARYIRRLQKHCAPHPDALLQMEEKRDSGQTPSGQEVDEDGAGASTSSTDPSRRFPVVIVSLLRKGTPDRDRSEAKLATVFDEAINAVRRECHLPITFNNIDWHEIDKRLGTERVIEALWTIMKPVLPQHGMAQGECVAADMHADGNDSRVCTPWGHEHRMVWSRHQMGINRYNCADSLDRTNVASFFVSVQVLVEQCRLLGLRIVSSGSGFTTGERIKRGLRERGGAQPVAPKVPQQQAGGWSGFGRSGLQAEAPQTELGTKANRRPLPEGWEVRSDILTGRQYYIDHVNKTTSWTLPVHLAEAALSRTQDAEGSPAPDQEAPASVPQGGVEAWDMLGSSVEVFRRTVMPEALSHMAEVFLMNGDRNAFLYTGSQAMHSDKLLIFEPETSQLRRAGGTSNSLIAITRRYNNLVRDNDRQAQIEMFLGLNHQKHFNCQVVAIAGQQSRRGPLLYLAGPLPQDYPDTDDDDEPIDRWSFTAHRSKSPIEAGAPLVASASVPDLRELSGMAAKDLGARDARSDQSDLGAAASEPVPPAAEFDRAGDADGSRGGGLEREVTIGPSLVPVVNCVLPGGGADGLSMDQWGDGRLREVPVDGAGPLELQ